MVIMVSIREIKAGGIGLIVGIVYATGIAFYGGSSVKEAKIFPRENKPAIMRMYKAGNDVLYVADTKDKNNYIPMKQHLEKIADESDRELEEATIKKDIGWYNE